MGKITKISLTFVFIFLPALTFAETGTRVYDYNGNFSFCPPLKWEAKKIPGLKYNIFIGPTENQFAANINFVDEVFDGSINDYIDFNLFHLEGYFQRYSLLSRKPFVTHSGIKGECVIINNEQQNSYLKQAFYFLSASNNKYFAITCSVLDAVSEKYLSVFEESIKTFELIN